MKCVKCGDDTDGWLLCQSCFDKTHKKERVMGWEVIRNGKIWTNGFSSAKAAEDYMRLEIEKMPDDIFEVREVL